MGKYQSLQERLMKNSKWIQSLLPEELGGCRVWTGYTQENGYVSSGTGYGKINLTYLGRSLKFPTHRVSAVLSEVLILKKDFDFYNSHDKTTFFELYFAYSACRLSIDHLCTNSLCFNPNHLEWVWMDKNLQRKNGNKKQSQIDLKKF